MRCVVVLLVASMGCVVAQEFDCLQVPIIQCCASAILRRCREECSAYASANCPDRLKIIDSDSGSNSVTGADSPAPPRAPAKPSRHEGSAGSRAHAAPIKSKAAIEIRTGDKNEEPTITNSSSHHICLALEKDKLARQ
uniref:Uncharacterized protein n=1 Tax=Plectus sambesii TaxID=2011161 RepID=A0A914VLJ1_9BILA